MSLPLLSLPNPSPTSTEFGCRHLLELSPSLSPRPPAVDAFQQLQRHRPPCSVDLQIPRLHVSHPSELGLTQRPWREAMAAAAALPKSSIRRGLCPNPSSASRSAHGGRPWTPSPLRSKCQSGAAYAQIINPWTDGHELQEKGSTWLSMPRRLGEVLRNLRVADNS